MLSLIALALCIIACNAGSLTGGQQPSGKSDASSQDWAVCHINGQELKPGQRATSGSFIVECQLTDNIVRTTIVACLDDGEDGQPKREHPQGDRWPVGKRPFRFIFECAKSGTMTVRKVAQCFYDSDDGQAKLDPGTEQKVGNNIIRCLKRGENGAQYNVTYGQSTSTNTGSNTNTNTNTNSGSSSTSSGSNTNTNSNSNSNTNTNTNAGSSSNTQRDDSWAVCNVNGQQIKPGQRASSADFLYECQLDGKTVRTQIIGCMDSNTPKSEHLQGERFVEGERPYRYVFECTKTGEVTQKKPVQCFYDSTEGQAKLDIGSEQQVGKYLIRCGNLGGGGVQYIVNYVQTPGDVAASAPASGNINPASAGSTVGVSATSNNSGNGTSGTNGQTHK